MIPRDDTIVIVIIIIIASLVLSAAELSQYYLPTPDQQAKPYCSTYAYYDTKQTGTYYHRLIKTTHTNKRTYTR